MFRYEENINAIDAVADENFVHLGDERSRDAIGLEPRDVRARGQSFNFAVGDEIFTASEKSLLGLGFGFLGVAVDSR